MSQAARKPYDASLDYSETRNRHDWLFELRIPGQFKGEPMIVIHAWDANHTDPQTGHMRIDCELRQGGKVIFQRGATYCAVNRWTGTDSDAAKELVMALFAMKPGDTDPDYFDSYSPEQLEWAKRNGEHLSCEREVRYCDESGNVR